MATSVEVKKIVWEDWQKAFPQLAPFSHAKLYKILGPLVIGLELINLPRGEGYRPYFVVYPLWLENLKESLETPIILKEYFNKKGLQSSIPYEQHDELFEDALISVKEQTPIHFEKSISLKKILLLLDEQSRTPPLSAAPDSYLQAVLQEAKLKIALYNNPKEAQKILKYICKRSWKTSSFQSFGADVDQWIHGLKEEISSRDNFLMQINNNRQDKKLSLLNSSELTV